MVDFIVLSIQLVFMVLGVSYSRFLLSDPRVVAQLVYKKDSKIGFEMSMIVVEAIRGRCTSFMVLTATVYGIFSGQTNAAIFVA